MGNSRQPGYPDKESGGENKSKNRRDERCDFVEFGIIETTSKLTDI